MNYFFTFFHHLDIPPNKVEMIISNEKKCFYFAVLIVLVFLMMMLVMRWARRTGAIEKLQNTGYPYAFAASSYNQGYARYPQSGISGGAYVRNLGQEMSQPKQGEYTSPSTMRVKGVDDFVHPEGLPGEVSHPGIVALADRARGERLVSGRGEPDFWELPQELRTAQVRQAGARYEKFLVGGTNTRAANDVDAYLYPHIY